MLPITEKDISLLRKVPVHSPILCAHLEHIGIDASSFVDHFKPAFAEMSWDYYDVKRKQFELLQANGIEVPISIFKSYYTDSQADQRTFLQSVTSYPQLIEEGLNISPWRRRSVCSFALELGKEEIELTRIYPAAFAQAVDGEDIRSLPRVFNQTEEALVDNHLFNAFLIKMAHQAQKVTPHINITKMALTAHFMSVKARQHIPGNNSPEGAHEDGADFIVSALVINRQNITGAKSQVLEKLSDGSMITLFERELQPGEFLFQADTGEEKHYGNDLWHYVTPFYVDNPQEESWRDIIGLDLEIILPKT